MPPVSSPHNICKREITEDTFQIIPRSRDIIISSENTGTWSSVDIAEGMTKWAMLFMICMAAL